MTRSRAALLPLLALVLAGCATRHAVAPLEGSGFLDDYTLLRAGGENELSLVYRNPAARWTAYDKVLLEPVTIWRSGRKSLELVPEEDLRRLALDFETAVRQRLGAGFQLVDQPAPGVLRIRLAITDARATDPILDVFTAAGDAPVPTGGGPLAPETRRFLEGAVIEGEVQDAETGTLLAQGIDRRRRTGSLEGVVDTWADLDRAFAFWADRVCGRLEKRAGRH